MAPLGHITFLVWVNNDELCCAFSTNELCNTFTFAVGEKLNMFSEAGVIGKLQIWYSGIIYTNTGGRVKKRYYWVVNTDRCSFGSVIASYW